MKTRLTELLTKRPHSGPFLLLIFSLAALLAAPAARCAEQAPRVLTLDEALQLAAQENRDIKKAVEYGNRVQGRYYEERSVAFPQINLTGTLNYTGDQAQHDLGLPRDTGAGIVNLGIVQPLFTWGKIPSAMRIARIGLQTAGDELAIARQGAVRDVTIAFYDVLMAKEVNRLAVENLEQKERHLDEAGKKFQSGTATDFDILAARVATDTARPDVIRSENVIRLARERLRSLLGIGLQEVDVAGRLEAVLQPIPAYAEVYETALKNRPELAELRRRVDILQELVKIARAGDKPSVNLAADAAWKDLKSGGKSGNGFGWDATLLVTVPIFDGRRTKGQVMQAQSDVADARIDETRLVDAISLQARDAVNVIATQAQILEAMAGTVQQAERLLAMAEKGFEFGVKTRLDVNDAQLNLLAAQSALAGARRDYQAAAVTLRWVMGTLDSPPAKLTGYAISTPQTAVR